MKSPIVKRSTYESLLQQNRKLSSEIVGLRHGVTDLEDDLKKANRLAEEILPRLVRIREPIRDLEFGTYRVCVDFHRDMVERGFTHGGNEQEIRYLAQMLSREVERKMIQFNFARCER